MATLKNRWAFGNVHQPGTVTARQKTIRMILDRAAGGVAMFNEAAKDHAYIKSEAAKRGMHAWCEGENALVWDNRFEEIARKKWQLTPGGHVGADGVHTAQPGDDDRRVGPGRFLLLVVLWDPTTGLPFFLSTTHYLAKAFTSAKWRKSLLLLGIRREGKYIRQIIDDVPNGIWAADTNMPGAHDIPGVDDFTVQTPATFGRSHYDKVVTFGDLEVTSADDINTPSDHDLLCGWMQVTGESEPRPTVDINSSGAVVNVNTRPKPKPKPAKRLRRPVPRPWRRRSARWKRRHPILWKKIVAWRKQNPRKRRR